MEGSIVIGAVGITRDERLVQKNLSEDNRFKRLKIEEEKLTLID